MPKSPVLSGKQMIRILKAMGCWEDRQESSHVIMKRTGQGGVELTSPVPLDDQLDRGTQRNILRLLQIDPTEFAKHLMKKK
jgi:predicted RNA binding protein YcfA (HicA-like mRNA interferase family)